jgi:nucleoside-diphosphate-sugar epimerase
MRIFLTGATGYLGVSILESFVRAGHEVTALVRDARKARRVQTAGATAVLGDLATGESWGASAAGHDAFVHAALEATPRGVDVDADRTAIETLATAARQSGRDRPLVYTSSVWVLGATRQRADESAPVNPVSFSAWRAPHETLVLELSGVRGIVVRPGIVYGGARGIVTDLFRSGVNGLVRVIGDGKNHWACVYDRDLAELYAKLVSAPDASGIYHATDEADESVLDIINALSRSTTHRPDIRFVPIEEARIKMGPYAEALALNQIVRSPRAHALGWTPSLRSISGNVPRLLEEWRVEHAAEGV